MTRRTIYTESGRASNGDTSRTVARPARLLTLDAVARCGLCGERCEAWEWISFEEQVENWLPEAGGGLLI